MFALIKTVAFLLLAAALTAGALLVPAHLRTSDPSVVEYAGGTGPTVEQSIRNDLDAAFIGPASSSPLASRSHRYHLPSRVFHRISSTYSTPSSVVRCRKLGMSVGSGMSRMAISSLPV
jgi:hypothetical protein